MSARAPFTYISCFHSVNSFRSFRNVCVAGSYCARANGYSSFRREFSSFVKIASNCGLTWSPAVDCKYYSENINRARSVMDFIEFENAPKKDERAFQELVEMYDKNFPSRKGLVDFIYAALRAMKEFGVEENLEAYRSLLKLFPIGKYVPENKIQMMFKHHYREQECGVYFVERMELNGLFPDSDMESLLIKIFGKHSDPLLRYMSLLYWAPKFINKSPWKLPKKLSRDPFDLSLLALKRITSVDLQTKINVFRTEDVDASIDKTWIISGQSREQRELLASHSPKSPVIVDGGDFVYIKSHRINYFTLISEAVPYVHQERPPSCDISNLKSNYFRLTYDEEKGPNSDSVHIQEDGKIYAVCVTGTSSEDSLLSWIRLLEEHGNPNLKNLAVLFRFRKPPSEAVPYTTQPVKKEDL